jgi:hypothetical protein
MIDFYVKARRDKQTGVEGVLEVEIVAEIDFHLYCEVMPDDENLNLALAIGPKIGGSGKVEIGRINGLYSASFYAESYEELSNELNDMALSGAVMDLYGATYASAVNTANFIDTLDEIDPEHQAMLFGAEDNFTRFFATHNAAFASGVQIPALVPHMLAQLDMIRQDDGATLISMLMPDMSKDDRVDMKTQFDKMEFNTIQGVVCSDEDGSNEFDLIIGSVGHGSFDIVDDIDFDGVFDLRAWAAENCPDAIAAAEIADAQEEAARAVIQ